MNRLATPLGRSTALSFLALALLAPLGAVEPEVGQDAPIIEAQTLRAHLEFLADDLLQGRDTGTDEYRIAAAYVAAQFTKYGLEPAGDDGTFLQTVTYRTTTLDEESVEFAVLQGKKKRKLTYKEDFLLGGDPAQEETTVEAELVFIGFGIDAPEFGIDSFAGIDLEGKIAISLTGSPDGIPSEERAHYSGRTTKRLAAADRGALGLLWIPSKSDAERRPWERRQRWAGRPSLTWMGEDGATGGLPSGLRVSAYLSQKAATPLFERAGHPLADLLELAEENPSELPSFALGQTAQVSFRSTHEAVTSPNVAGLLPGSDPELSHETVVYTAHLDHVGVGREVEGDTIYNGAYDNAMGSAITLAVAEAMADMETRPRRSVLFLLVGGEEKGLLGSSYFAQYPTVAIENIVADINIDMPLMLAPLDQIIAFGSEHSTLEAAVADAAAVNGFTLIPDPKPEQRLFVRSDQYSFVRRGVPSIYLVPGANSTDPEIDGEQLVEDFVENHYHRPSDDLSQPVDWPTAERFSRTNLLIGLIVANEDERPSWNEGSFFGEVFGRR